jgi:hypothetical protein
MGRGRMDFPGERRETEKEEFPGIMEITPPGNSFPQICSVSVSESVKKGSAKDDQ